MNAKKWIILLLSTVSATLILFMGLMFWLDPLLHYGAENDLLSYYEYSQMYSNPGIAKHYTYDSVLIGTSMIENTSVDLCEELFSCSMVRLPYSGGTTYNMKKILEVCFASENRIKTVYWELDEFQLSGSPTEPRYPLPEYLYRTDHKQDLSYLLNLDILYHYGLNSILGTLQGYEQGAARRKETLTGDYTKENTLNSYARPQKTDAATVFFGTGLQEKVDANLRNVTTLMEAHPETEFVFFMPPFSVLYWDREMRMGKFDATMDSVQYALEALLQYENARVYFYQCEEEIITDLDNYKDYSHYGSWINDTISRYIAEDRNRVTPENCEDMVAQMRSFIHEYNFEDIFWAEKK